MGTPAVPGQTDQPDPSGVGDGQDNAVTGDDTPDSAAEGSEGDGNAADDSADDDDGDDGESLGLTPDELKAVKADPKLKKLYANLHKGFTQGRQRDSAAVRLLQSYQADPAGTVRALAQRAGVRLAEVAAPSSAKASDAVLDELKEAVGDDLAGKLLPLVQKIAGEVAKSTVEPLRRDLDVTMAQAVQEQAEMVKSEFTRRHPDFKKHEAAMMKAATTIRPAQGADALEYMEVLYTVATRKNGGEGDAAARARDRMVSAAAGGGERHTGTPGNRVAPARPDMSKLPKRERLEAAMKAAMRGEKWD